MEKIKGYEIAIAVFAYRRADTLTQVLTQVIRQNPQTLYIFLNAAADEPEKKAVENVKQTILQLVPVDCNLKLIEQREHLQIGKHFQVALNYLFSNEESALVFEDDTVPSDLFFVFAKEMLKKYEFEEGIMHISGCNLNAFQPTDSAGYLFTPFTLPSWGWATWARAWKKYDFNLTNWAQQREQVQKYLADYSSFWVPVIDRYAKVLRAWDVQWNVALWENRAKAILPTQNLVNNIGFNPQGTFTSFSNSAFKEIKFQSENYNGTFVKFEDEAREKNYADAIISLIHEINHNRHLKKSAGEILH